ncbi:hypothetical protein EDD85DRAFT_637571 [Armillaria nabsnona]|nr:hypothetical protein EDD85DRAFT_637571 [Armillaria nabsnona]
MRISRTLWIHQPCGKCQHELHRLRKDAELPLLLYHSSFACAVHDIVTGGNRGYGTPEFDSAPCWDPMTGPGTTKFELQYCGSHFSSIILAGALMLLEGNVH